MTIARCAVKRGTGDPMVYGLRDVAHDWGILNKRQVKFGAPASKSASSVHGSFSVTWLLHGATAHIRSAETSCTAAGFDDSKMLMSISWGVVVRRW